jgi:hypothetical protein
MMAEGEIWLDCNKLFCFAGCCGGFISPYASQMKSQLCYLNIKQTHKNNQGNIHIQWDKTAISSCHLFDITTALSTIKIEVEYLSKMDVKRIFCLFN